MNVHAGLYVVQSSKTGETSYTNYEDICYSTGEGRDSWFDLINLTEWGSILAVSAKGIEVRDKYAISRSNTTKTFSGWAPWSCG